LLGNNNFSTQASGAYIFRPNRTQTFDVSSAYPTIVAVVNGLLIQEVKLQFSSWVQIIYRLYYGQSHVETEMKIGEIPIDDGMGKEVVTKYKLFQLNKIKILIGSRLR
jgi:hypothetical protein